MNGERLLLEAHRTIETAGSIVTSDPESAYVLTYDATRHACTALLAQQGLRPTSGDGHYAVERAVRARSAGFRDFGAMRRRRNELQYPSAMSEHADREEAGDAITSGRELISAAGRLLPALQFF